MASSPGLSLDRAIMGIQKGIESARLTASQLVHEDKAKKPAQEVKQTEGVANAGSPGTGNQAVGAIIDVTA